MIGNKRVRTSIERAARKYVELNLFDDHDPYCSPNYLKPTPPEMAKHLVRFALRERRNYAKAVAAVRRGAIREAAKVAASFFPRTHTYASENADVYHAQDAAQAAISKSILKLLDPRGAKRRVGKGA